ncbi:hypothetical protein VTN00DRAFT_255 [Thermoascus crustaceus]|uniref:uncharacterized protein n=1 Tax=Thermoascus crustaceus TaxID=5088 RepID=UPI00374244F5
MEKNICQQKETFVLALPDFDSQNIMIDERGNLTGIIDWDNVQTAPRFLGHSSFPGWITRDWDPVIYYYPENKEREISPEELRRYRQRYNTLPIATTDDIRRLEILRKIVARVLSVDADDALEVIRDVGSGMLKKKDKVKLRAGLQALLSVPR